MSTENKPYATEPQLVNSLWLCLIAFSLIILIPILSYNSFFKPVEDPANIWFQRSGALITICALFMDLQIYRINQFLNPSGYVSVGFSEFKSKYNKLYVFLTIIGFLSTVAGTVVWGYGDLLVEP